MYGWVQKLMKLLRVRGMPPDLEVCITVGMCYLTYYITAGPLHWSGVIAVVVFGLYGSATLKWDMSAFASQEHFPRFWDVLSQVLASSLQSLQRRLCMLPLLLLPQ
jgi:NhaP-type Na+/H+ or K+/H+ antiporter